MTTEDRRSFSPWISNFLTDSALLLLVVALYGQTITFDFLHWDDDKLIVENPYFQLPFADAGRALATTGYAGLYMPVTFALWKVQYDLPSHFEPGAEPAAWIFHLTSLVLMALLALAVRRLITRLIVAGWPTFLGAALFVVHPLQAESVSWISEQKGLLSVLFAVLALISYIDAARAGSRSIALLHWTLATLCYVLALLSKPWAVAVPLLAIVIDRGFLRRSSRPIFASTVPWFLLGTAFIAIARSVQGDYIEVSTPFAARPRIATTAVCDYLAKFFFPIALAPDYGNSVDLLLENTPAWIYFVSLALVIALAFLAVWWWFHPSRWGAVAFLFLATLVPVLGFIPFAYQSISIVADRYMLPALLAAGLGLALLLDTFQFSILRVLASGFIAALAVLNFHQCQAWRDDHRLIEFALRANPASAPFLSNLSKMQLEDGDYARAEKNARTAVARRPRFTPAHYNLAVAMAQQGRVEEAVQSLINVLIVVPNDHRASELLAQINLRAGRCEQAVKWAKRLVERPTSTHADAQLLSHALILSGKEAEGLALLTQPVGTPLSPPVAELLIARVFEEAGDAPNAESRLHALLKQYPNFSEAKARLAWLLATTFDDAVHDPRKALKLARELKRTGKGGVEDLDLQAAALAASSDFAHAGELASTAVSRARELSEYRLAREINQRRELYETGKPYRTTDPRLARIHQGK